jgi:hypothetical protein
MGWLGSATWLIIILFLWAFIYTGNDSFYWTMASQYLSDPTVEDWVKWVIRAIPIVVFGAVLYKFLASLSFSDNEARYQ